MPALSQTLTFKIANGSTTTNSTQVSYSNTATGALFFNSEKIQGTGYFGGGNGLHTVAWQVSDFIGAITIQGTLSSDPQNADWSTVTLTTPANQYSLDTTGAIKPSNTTSTVYTTATDAIKTYNFVGNYVWVRARISNMTQGVVYSISINR
jgi:hypothetical protein